MQIKFFQVQEKLQLQSLRFCIQCCSIQKFGLFKNVLMFSFQFLILVPTCCGE